MYSEWTHRYKCWSRLSIVSTVVHKSTGAVLKKRCGNAVPTPNKKEDCTKCSNKVSIRSQHFHTGSSCFTADFWLAVRNCLFNYSLLLLSIEPPICTRRTTTRQFIWQQQHTCGALGGSPMECGVGGQPHRVPYFHPHNDTHSQNDPRKNSLGLAQLPPHRCRTFPLLLVQMGYVLFCGLLVELRRINRRPCCPPMSNPSTSSWTAWPGGSGRWDNWMAAQHLPRDLVRPSSG